MPNISWPVPRQTLIIFMICVTAYLDLVFTAHLLCLLFSSVNLINSLNILYKIFQPPTIIFMILRQTIFFLFCSMPSKLCWEHNPDVLMMKWWCEACKIENSFHCGGNIKLRQQLKSHHVVRNQTETFNCDWLKWENTRKRWDYVEII